MAIDEIERIREKKIIFIYGGDFEECVYIIKNSNLHLLDEKNNNFHEIAYDDLFGESKTFLINKISQQFLEKNKKLISEFEKTNNFLILTSKDFIKIKFENSISINSEDFLAKIRKNYFFNLAKQYEIIKILNDKQIEMINDLLMEENLQNVENEVRKLSLFLHNRAKISDDEIYAILNLSKKNAINDLIESIICKDQKNAFFILNNLDIDDEIYIIRCIYNYFLKLQRVFVIGKFQNPGDFIARSGIFFGKITREIVRKNFTMTKINNILNSIAEHEIGIKSAKKYELERLLIRVFS